MKVRVIDKPCLFAETVYLLYYYINGIAYTRDYERVNRKFGRYLLEKEDQGLQLAQELDHISAAVTQTLDPHQARLRYFFEKLPGTDEKTCCCLAHTMLVATPLNCTDIDSFAAELLRMFRYMSGIGFKINDMNTMGLVLEPLDPQEEPEPLQVQLERLPCSMEARWEILRVLTEFETYLRELTELLRPVAEQLAAEMQALTERNRAQLAIWEKYFQTHSVDTFQQEMCSARRISSRRRCSRMRSGSRCGTSTWSASGRSGSRAAARLCALPISARTSALNLRRHIRSGRMPRHCAP